MAYSRSAPLRLDKVGRHRELDAGDLPANFRGSTTRAAQRCCIEPSGAAIGPGHRQRAKVIPQFDLDGAAPSPHVCFVELS
jgi:hypothetical protein